jgi:hypothetical protein
MGASEELAAASVIAPPSTSAAAASNEPCAQACVATANSGSTDARANGSSSASVCGKQPQPTGLESAAAARVSRVLLLQEQAALLEQQAALAAQQAMVAAQMADVHAQLQVLEMGEQH